MSCSLKVSDYGFLKQSNKKTPKCIKFINSDSAWTENGILFTMAMDTCKIKKNVMVSCDAKGWPYRTMCYVHWLDVVITNCSSIPGGNHRFPCGCCFNITCFKMCSLKIGESGGKKFIVHSCLSKILSWQPPNRAAVAVDQDIKLLKLMTLTS